MPHTTKTSNKLFIFNPIMPSCHSNQKTQFGNSPVTDDGITLDATWEDISWQMLSCCGLTFFYLWNCQSYKAFKKVASKDSGIIFMIMIIYFNNYWVFWIQIINSVCLLACNVNVPFRKVSSLGSVLQFTFLCIWHRKIFYLLTTDKSQ